MNRRRPRAGVGDALEPVLFASDGGDGRHQLGARRHVQLRLARQVLGVIPDWLGDGPRTTNDNTPVAFATGVLSLGAELDLVDT